MTEADVKTLVDPKTEDFGDGSPATQTSASPTPPPSKSKLRLAKGEKGVSTRSKSMSVVLRRWVGAATPSGGQPVKKEVGQTHNFRAFNAVLIGVVVVMVGLTCLEIRAHTQTTAAVKQIVPSVKVEQVASKEPSAPPSLNTAKILESFGKGDLFRREPAAVGERPVVSASGLQTLGGILNLIGTSSSQDGRTEAILVDTKENKLHVVQLGQKIIVGERELVLEDLGKNEAILTDGTEKITVKPRVGGAGS